MQDQLRLGRRCRVLAAPALHIVTTTLLTIPMHLILGGPGCDTVPASAEIAVAIGDAHDDFLLV
ncbi:hypothetical protein AXA44_36190 [Rhodococcus sp. SC4]|nr:hypothetical protein AXA44_36190 [Rhodococcus sp. SC4]